MMSDLRIRLIFPGKNRVSSMIRVNPVLNFLSEMPYEPLHRPSSSVSQGANGVAFNLSGELIQHIDLCIVSPALLKPQHHLVHPRSAFSAGSALATGLVLVEFREAGDGGYHVY